MDKLIDPTRLAKQSYVNALIKDAKSFIENQFSALSSKVLRVEVTNKDTNLLKEVAESSRKSASRGLELVGILKSTLKVGGEVKVSNLSEINIPEPKDFPTQIDVNVLNQKEIVIPEVKIPEYPTEISVKNLKDIKFPEFKQEKLDTSSLEKLTKDVKTALSDIKAYLPRLEPKDIVLPEPIKPKDFPKSMSLKESKDIIEALQGVRDDLGEIYKVIDEKEMGGSGNTPVITSSGSTVTNINVNALRGIAKTTAVTVTSAVTSLPTSNLTYRRSLIVYNNSANTIYIGGSDVTVNNGLPVPASSYSPPVDAGMNMDLYAVAASGSNNVRVFEVSSEREGA